MNSWRYATISFQPYPDVGEFLTIGILAVAVPARILAYRLLSPKATSRIKGFFPEISISVYREALRLMKLELASLQAKTNLAGNEKRESVVLGDNQNLLPGLEETSGETLFKMLTKPRDGILRIHAKGVRIASDPDQLLDALSSRYLDREGGSSGLREETLDLRMEAWLKEWKLRPLYRRSVQVGPDEFHVRFPFAYQLEEGKPPQCVIKPLDFAQATSTKTYHHGDLWVANLSRLTRLAALPDLVLLPVQMPLASRGATSAMIRAAEESRAQLTQLGATVVEADDTAKLRKLLAVELAEKLVLQAG